MNYLILITSLVFLLIGHAFRIVRWSRFIEIHEKSKIKTLLRALSVGYAVNMLIPFKLGDVVRTIYAGKRMKGGIGFSLATVILDRFLDIIVAVIVFACFYLKGNYSSQIIQSIHFYLIIAGSLFIGLIFVKLFSKQVKRIVVLFSSIFNSSVKLWIEKFFWTLINTFRDIKKINLWKVCVDTLIMWIGYFSSYVLLALFFSKYVENFSLIEIITILFSKSAFDSNVLGILNSEQYEFIRMVLCGYIILPVVIMLLISKLHYFKALDKKETDKLYFNMLPQIDEQDQLKFLDEYFSAEKSDLIKKFIAFNSNINILTDYSAGSNATTMLCLNRDKTFYRKYAFGADGKKLLDQLNWLKDHEDTLPICEIIHQEYDEGYCCYDMAYSSDAVGMFQYIHSHPIEKSQAILENVLEKMQTGLYTKNCKQATKDVIENYLTKKVDANLNAILSAKELKTLVNSEVVIINGKPYKNLNQLMHLFNHDYLIKIFENDKYSDIHGDLTIENIICLNNVQDIQKAFYIIDPNTGNIHDSAYLDYGKLLQSLHGGYEFMMKTKAVSVEENHINFMSTRSSAYDDLLCFIKELWLKKFGKDGLSSIFHHEIIHWLRLMPYKIRSDKNRAAMFYAGLVMVANDVEDWFNGEK